MRWFWIVISVIAVGALVVALRPRSETIDILTAPVTAPVTSPAPALAPPRAPVTAPSPPRSDPRSTQLDGRFDILGTGSQLDPYRVTWSLMKSAEDPSEPNGQVRVPKYLALLDGTAIEISGYLAPPVQQAVTSELLVMQKRWDGCCIGTPPTPFDCIEVRLDQPLTMRAQHLIQYGTVRGTLRIEPFVAGKFLLGLYRIEHGAIEGEIEN